MRTDRIAIIALLIGGGCVIVDNTPKQSCVDGIRNGAETDIDCGGSSCGACSTGERCVIAADCASGVCTGGICGDHTSGSPIQGTPSVAAMQIYRITPGAGIVDVIPGTDIGYFITANVGGSYRLVFTGDANTSGAYREFWGSVWTKGHFVNGSVVPGCAGQMCPNESGDFVSAPHAVTGGERIDFDTIAGAGLDGFDFAVDTEPSIFDLYINEGQYADKVFFVSPDTSPANMLATTAGFPFGLTTQ